MIAVIDYGIGNLGSVLNMFRKIGVDQVIATRDKNEIRKADKLLLPGVGAFDAGMERLEESGLIPVLTERVLKDQVPVLGICLGMQMLSRRSEEGIRPGLGWLAADTLRLDVTKSPDLRVPHMGWERIKVHKPNPLIVPDNAHRFYFVHSYHVRCDDRSDVIATCSFGEDFDCVIAHGNIYGAQFHPEKSLRYGMQFLANFASI